MAIPNWNDRNLYCCHCLPYSRPLLGFGDLWRDGANRYTALYDNLNSFFLFVLCFSTIIASPFFGWLAIQEPRPIMDWIFLLGIVASILSIGVFRSEFDLVSLHPLYEVVKLASIAVWLGLPNKKAQTTDHEKYRTARTFNLASPRF